MASSKLSILVQAVGAAKAAKDLKGVDRAVSGIGASAGKGLRKAGENLARLGLAAGTAAAGGLVVAVKAAGDFEASLNTINTILGDTKGTELAAIGDSLRKMARDTGTSLEDLAGGYYDLLSAGIKSADAQNVLTAANRLAIGGLATTAETINLLTGAINVYGGDASKAAEDADIFAKAIERGKVTASDIAASFAVVGPAAQAAGLELDEIGAAYARLTAINVPAAEAMTQMKSAIKALLDPSKQLHNIQDLTHVDFAKIAKDKGLVFALQAMRDAVEGNYDSFRELTDVAIGTNAKKRLKELVKDLGGPDKAFIQLFGRIEAFQYALATTGPNFEAFGEDLDAMRNSAGTASAQMGFRQQGLNYELSRLKALAKDAAISIGTKLLPKITTIAKRIADFLGSARGQSLLTDLANGISRAFDNISDIAARVDWNSIGASLKLAGLGARAVVEAFLATPPWVQQAVLTGWGLNKLTGGAVTGILGQVASGLIKGVLGMNAGVVNIKAGVVNGGGAAGAAGGLAGKIGTGLAVASSAILVAEAAKTYFDVNNATTSQATGIAADLDRMLASNPTQQQMASALAAIDTGIAQIQSNPLLVLVQGDALNQLKAMKEKLGKVIGRAQTGGLSIDDRDELKPIRDATESTYDSLERNRATLGTKTDAVAARVTSSSREIVTALRSLHFTLDVKGLTVTARDVSSASNTADAYAVPTAFNRGWVPVGI